MKKLLLGAAALFLMTGCSGNGTSEKTREDSARIADSIAQVEAPRQNLSEDEASKTANDNQDDPMQLHLADFLVPMK